MQISNREMNGEKIATKFDLRGLGAPFGRGLGQSGASFGRSWASFGGLVGRLESIRLVTLVQDGL